MTEELKTVKDLRHKDNKSVMGETYLIREDRLREEAIKHAKKDQRLAMESKIIDVDNFNFLLGRISFAKEFLNIIDEDLIEWEKYAKSDFSAQTSTGK